MRWNPDPDADPDDAVWVAIRVSDGSSTGVVEYRGRMDAEVFRQITTNDFMGGWFELTSVFWDQDGQAVPLVVAGRQWGYSNTVYLRAESVARIIVLDESFVRKLSRG